MPSAVERALAALLVAATCSACAWTGTADRAVSDPIALPTATAPSEPAPADPGATDPAAVGPSTDGPTSGGTAAVPSAAPGTALAALRRLTVKGRAPLTGYRRAEFGEGWRDTDRNGCDARNDVLARDLVQVVLRPGTCLVSTGVLHDPYTGETIRFVRGALTSSAVQIDHVVALADAWQKGAQRWSRAQRVLFANDPLNLLAVGGPVNQEKGAGDAATWLPPRTAYRCAYVARQIAVKAKYAVSVTAAENDALARVLSRCPGQRLPS